MLRAGSWVTGDDSNDEETPLDERDLEEPSIREMIKDILRRLEVLEAG